MDLPEKRSAECLGETIEYVRAGTGPVTVVLLNGSGGPIEGWHKVLKPLSEFATVIAYNRPGIGRSSKPRVPQTGTHMAASLRRLLEQADIAPPYVLVGHSLGGLIVNLFSRLYPAEVSGVVLLEATSPNDVGALEAYEGRVQRVLRWLLAHLTPLNPMAETEHLAVTVAELRSAPAFPTIPLIVVTGAQPAMAWATGKEARLTRARHQAALAGISPLGRQVIAERSGHFIQFTEPDVIVCAVRAMVT